MVRETSKKKAAAGKKAAYAAARGRGVSKVNAVKKAGYRPKSRRAAHAIAARIEKSLTDRQGLEEALAASGITLSLTARVLKRGLTSRSPDRQIASLKALTKILRWDRDDGARPPGEDIPFNAEELIELRRRILDLPGQSAQSGAADGGPAVDRAAAGPPTGG